MKPFKGKIYHWNKRTFDKDSAEKFYGEDCGLGYVIEGYRTDPPKFGSWFHTSWVVKHFENGMIETRNSHYELVGEENVPNS